MELVIVALILFGVMMVSWLMLPGTLDTPTTQREEIAGRPAIEQLA